MAKKQYLDLAGLETYNDGIQSQLSSKANSSDLTSHTGNKSNPHGVTKAQVGLGNVENKSSATIRGELTKANVTTALGYTPPTTNTTYSVVSTTADGLAPKRDGSTTKYLRADGTWATPPDNNTTYSTASSSTAGLVKIGYTESGKNYPVELNDSGQMYVNVPWTDNNTTYSNMTAATASAAGKAGLVPAPAAGKQTSFLRGDGTWVVPTNTTYSVVSTTADGLAPKRDGSTTKFLRGDGTWAVPPDTNTTYSVATTSANGLMSSTDKTKSDATNIAYGTCSTAAATAAKVIAISGNTNWKLAAGSMITVVFSATNTAESPTFNVNSTGAKNVFYGSAQITTSSLGYAGTANRPMTFMYDGTQYRFIGWGYDSNTTYTNVKLGHGYCTCSTAAATVAKTASLSSYTLTTGGIVAVKFTYDVPASATLNINSKGAKAIYYNGAAITAGVIKAGDTATFIYSSQYHLIGINRDLDVTHPNVTAGTASGGSGTKSHGGTFTIPSITYDANGHITSTTTTTVTLPAAYSHPTYTARTGKPTANQTPAFGGTATVSQITSDGTGHVTGATDRTITIPSTLSNGTGTAGLIKTTSTVTSNSGYTACPVISGVPYYKDTNTTYSLSSFGVTATAAELNALDGITATVTELNYVDGVTSNIQTQLNGKAASSHTHDYLPLSGGSLTGAITVPRGTAYQSLDTAGAAKPLVWISSEDAVMLGATSTDSAHSGNTQVNAPNGSVYLKCKNDKILQWYYYTDSSVGTKTIFAPNANAEAKLGSSSYRWYKLYASSTCSTSSDEREKSDIMSIEDYPVTYSRDGSGNVFEKLFDKLIPKTYTLNVESSGELHIGFVAQDIVNALEELGLSENDLALLDHDYWIDEETGEEKDRYGLSYEQFVALNTYIIQKQKVKIEEQQVQIESLEERITRLEKLVNGN